MNDKTISKEAPENILQCWNLSGTAEQIYSTAWQVNDKYVLKRYEDLETLKKNAEMLTVLHEMGIPVAEIIPVPSGDPYACCDERYYMLSKKLPGNNETDIIQEGIAEKWERFWDACIWHSGNVRSAWNYGITACWMK